MFSGCKGGEPLGEVGPTLRAGEIAAGPDSSVLDFDCDELWAQSGAWPT